MLKQEFQIKRGILEIHYEETPIVPDCMWYKWMLLHQFTMVHPDEFAEHLNTPVPIASTITKLVVRPGQPQYFMGASMHNVFCLDELAQVEHLVARFLCDQSNRSITFYQALQMHDAW